MPFFPALFRALLSVDDTFQSLSDLAGKSEMFDAVEDVVMKELSHEMHFQHTL